jgi:hypothetical protein
MTTKKKWLIAVGSLVLVSGVAIFVTASVAKKRFEPYIRTQAIEYLRARFDSDVELASLSIYLPKMSSMRLLLTHGRGAVASVEGEGSSYPRRSASRCALSRANPSK